MVAEFHRAQFWVLYTTQGLDCVHLQSVCYPAMSLLGQQRGTKWGTNNFSNFRKPTMYRVTILSSSHALPDFFGGEIFTRLQIHFNELLFTSVHTESHHQRDKLEGQLSYKLMLQVASYSDNILLFNILLFKNTNNKTNNRPIVLSTNNVLAQI